MSALPERESRLLMERERPMSANEWKQKTEERKRIKLLRQLEKLSKSEDSRARSMDLRIPLDITCRQNEGLVQFAPSQHGSYRYDREWKGSIISPSQEEASRTQGCGSTARDTSVRGRGKTRMERLKEEDEGGGEALDTPKLNNSQLGKGSESRQ